MARALHKTWLLDPLGAAAGLFAYGVFRLLPAPLASALGGVIGRAMGRVLRGLDRRAESNLRHAMPELSVDQRRHIRRGMWDNLGRTIAELPHLDWICRNRLDLVGAEHFRELDEDGRPGAIYCAHLANWELELPVPALAGLATVQVYRELNNPWLRPLMRHIRQGRLQELVTKGPSGAKRLIATMQAGGHIGLMADQKMNDGIAVPFFGQRAMTATALVQLCLRYQAPLVAMRMERLDGCRFRCTAYPPWQVTHHPDGKAASIEAALLKINLELEDWIRARPEQWLWIHRRWN